GRVVERANQPALADADSGDIERDGDMTRQPAAARMGIPLAVAADRTEGMLQPADRLKQGGTFAKAEKSRDVRHFSRDGGASDVDDGLRFTIVDDGGCEDGLLVG